MKRSRKRVTFSVVYTILFSLTFLSGTNAKDIQHEGGHLKGSIISGDEKQIVIRGDKEGRVIVVKVLAYLLTT